MNPKKWLWLLAVPYAIVNSTGTTSILDSAMLDMSTHILKITIEKSGDCIDLNGENPSTILIASGGVIRSADKLCVEEVQIIKGIKKQ